ncbi:hypothetical protein QBC38DRAFT_424312 [Podospora fimiseda]|uniref:Uncharacterized protein n=1 Tax=Podospora fimiseda TaxID=252190 RepID=A0AAN7BIQ5_9PEZI|nr:hypothetical protein QBC38DRAFT_424312 [Podospora fimiseda]
MPEFLFVNPGNKSQSGHKISTSARAFVIRKARATQPWSTKRLKPRAEENLNGEGRADPRLINSTEGVETATVERPAPLPGPPPKSSKPSGVVKNRKAAAPKNSINKRGGNSLSAEAIPPQKETPATQCPQCGHAAINGAAACICQSAGATMVSTARQLSGRLDPFGSLAVEMNERDTTLLAYFTTAINPTLTPLPPSQSDLTQKLWVTISFSHRAFMHSTLCLASLQLAVAQPHQSPVLLERFMHHRVQTIKHIQSALSDPTTALSDENIATVFQMLCIEENLFLHADGDSLSQNPAWKHLSPDKSQREAHLEGLKRMLSLRGGVEALKEMRGLQAFVIRWVCTSLGCRLVFSLPKPRESTGGKYLYKPENKNEWDAAHLDDVTFAASKLLPRGLLNKLYDYPACSPFFHGISIMAEGCEGVGMRKELVEYVKTVDCLMKDAMSWFFSRDQYRTWDALDMQNLLSIGMGELIRWYLENEAGLSAAENVTAMGLFIFIFVVGNGAHAACSPLPGVMPRMRQHFRDSALIRTLQAAGIETWVGFLLLIASSQNPASGDYFFRYNIEMLAARDPPVRTFDDYKATLLAGVWTPVMEPNAMKGWEELQGPLEMVRGEGVVDFELLKTLKRPRPKDAHVKPTIPMSNPYATSHMKKVFSPEKENIPVDVV